MWKLEAPLAEISIHSGGSHPGPQCPGLNQQIRIFGNSRKCAGLVRIGGNGFLNLAFEDLVEQVTTDLELAVVNILTIHCIDFADSLLDEFLFLGLGSSVKDVLAVK